MKSFSAAPPYALRLSAIALAVTALSGCTTIGDWFSGDKVDYRNAKAKQQPLDVPPDLTQLARESRYQPQGGVISASGVGAAPPAGAGLVSASGLVAPASVGDLRVEREGQLRWLVAPLPPERLWPLLKSFWEQRGFKLETDNPIAGVMETDWVENRAKLPNDIIRNTLGRFLGTLYDTGERDRYRTRVERTATGSEIYISHRGMEETYINERKESTVWRSRPNDPQLEAEILTSLMVALGTREEPARTALATATDKPVKARVDANPQATSLVVEEPFDRAWRRVGLALDRGGFTVEDRDRASGLYYVRYVDPKSIGKDEPSWWSKLFGDGANPQAALRYRIVLKNAGEKTLLSVQTSAGAADTGENAKRIVGLLAGELR